MRAKSLILGVADGIRTHDNWNHKPLPRGEISTGYPHSFLRSRRENPFRIKGRLRHLRKLDCRSRIKHLLIALAMFAATPALAATSCPPGSVSAQLPDGSLICAGPPDVFCEAPLRRVCSAAEPWRCHCAAPDPAQPQRFCEVRVVYPQNDPSRSFLVVYPGCHSGSVNLALSAALARALGMPEP